MTTANSGQSSGLSVQAETLLEVEMSADSAPEMEKELPKCGRLVFRGVELAYLNIDGEYMLPLAELLALVLPSTPRTTLFTRMEKMKVRRHFCQPEEIKLLKTVNGIHGSSANCTLLSKTEVDKYCSIYIDNSAENSKENKNNGICSDDITNQSKISNGENGAVHWEGKVNVESAFWKNNEISKKLKLHHKHRKLSSNKGRQTLAKISNSVKLKSTLSPVSPCNQTLTDEKNLEQSSRAASADKYDLGNLPKLPKSHSCAAIITYCSQTQSLLNNNNKRLKKRDKNCNSALNDKRKSARSKKRPSSDNEIRQEFEAPLKIPKRSVPNVQKQPNTSEFLKFPSSQKNDGDSLVSDCSSIDSGFASNALSNASTPTKTDFSAVELSGLLRKDEEAIREDEHPNLRPSKFKTPTKNKSPLGNSLTLSPPTLVLKRYEDSWLVEQKSPDKDVNCLQKKKLKSSSKVPQDGRLSLHFDVTCGRAKTNSAHKQVRKRRKRRKPPNFKEEAWITSDLIMGEKPDVSGSRKKKEGGRRKEKEELGDKITSSNEQTLDEEKRSHVLQATKTEMLLAETQSSCNFATAEEKNKGARLLGNERVLDKLVGNALDNFFGRRTSTIAASQPVVDGKSSTYPIPKKPKVVAPKKTVLKINSNFKFLDLFPMTSQLRIEEGGNLCPVFTMSCPEGARPPSSHPLWKWRLGGPVFHDLTPHFVKPKSAPKPKKTFPESAAKTCNKERRFKRKLRKMLPVSQNKEMPPSSAPMNVSCTNATNSDIKANQDTFLGRGEFNQSANNATSTKNHFSSHPVKRTAN